MKSKKDRTLIWVPPKTPPSLPIGPQPEAPKPEDYVATTYMDHELSLCREALQALGLSIGISCLMSFKFGIHMSCMMNCAVIPLELYENILVKAYILGVKEDNAYKEFLSDPNVEPPRVEELDDEPPKVEELDDEDSNDKSKKSREGNTKDDNSGDELGEDTVKIEKSDVADID